MPASDYQRGATNLLKEIFGNEMVRAEWSVATGATDSSQPRVAYAPRLDIAVGPFNITPNVEANVPAIRSKVGHRLMAELIEKAESENSNPRCLLAIEIEFSGSSKHILGDFTNASMIGLVGVVIAPPGNFEKASRIYEYVRFVRAARKAPADLFKNLVLFKTDDFLTLLRRNM